MKNCARKESINGFLHDDKLVHDIFHLSSSSQWKTRRLHSTLPLMTFLQDSIMLPLLIIGGGSTWLNTEQKSERVKQKGLQCYLSAPPNEGIAFTIIGSKERDNTKHVYAEIESNMIPNNTQCAQFAVGKAHRHLFGTLTMEGWGVILWTYWKSKYFIQPSLRSQNSIMPLAHKTLDGTTLYHEVREARTMCPLHLLQAHFFYKPVAPIVQVSLITCALLCALRLLEILNCLIISQRQIT